MKEHAVRVQGIIPPVITPFDEDQNIDEEAYRSEIRYTLNYDVKGIVAGGTTGEGAVLSKEELARIYTIAVEEAKDKTMVIAGVITDSTREAIDVGLAAREIGVDQLMVTPVHYYRPTLKGLVEFYQQISDEVGLPIIIYNVVSIVPVTPDAMDRLADVENIVAIKQSIAGSMSELADIIQRVGDRISVVSAYDPTLLQGLSIGARGTISSVNAIMPELSVEMYDAVQRNDLPTAQSAFYKIFRVARLIDIHNWASWVKEAIRLQGRPAGPARSPMVALEPEEREQMRQALIYAGLIK